MGGRRGEDCLGAAARPPPTGGALGNQETAWRGGKEVGSEMPALAPICLHDVVSPVKMQQAPSHFRSSLGCPSG